MWPHVTMPVLRPCLYYGHKWPVPRVAVIEAFYCILKSEIIIFTQQLFNGSVRDEQRKIHLTWPYVLNSVNQLLEPEL